MQNNLLNSRGLHVITGLIFLSSVTLFSCTKTSNNQTVTPVSILSVIDVSPDAPALDFYENSTVINTNAINYGSGLAYFNSYAGNVAFSFDGNGTSTKLGADNVTLTANHYYTLILANSIKTPDFILLADTLVSPGQTNSSIRFINASANAPAVDVVVKKGSVLINNIAYKGVTKFVSAPVMTNDTLQVLQAGTSTVLATLPNITFESAGAYTIWLYGVPGSTTTPLTIGAMQNAAF